MWDPTGTRARGTYILTALCRRAMFLFPSSNMDARSTLYPGRGEEMIKKLTNYLRFLLSSSG